jgi:hypothetical protein
VHLVQKFRVAAVVAVKLAFIVAVDFATMAAIILRYGSPKPARYIAQVLPVLKMQFEIRHTLSWASVVELAWTIRATYPGEVESFVAGW